MAPTFRRAIPVWLLIASVSFNVQAQNVAESASQKSPANRRAALTAEIAEASALALKLRQIADTVDNDHWIGTMYNEVDLGEHRCYALGLLLGQEGAVRHLRFNRNPSIRARNPMDAHDVRVIAQSLENFESAAKSELSVTEKERAMAWNLDCVGHLGIHGSPIQITGATTFFQLQREGRVLQILGNIEPGFTANLRKAIESNPRVVVVSLGSGGGSVYEALSAGRLIRKSGLETTLWNNCYSACPLVFAGGIKRTIWSPYPSLGFHKVYSKEGVAPLNAQVYRDIAAYLMEMNIAPKFVLENMFRAEPSEMNLIRGDKQLCASRLTTWIQRFCDMDD